MTPRFATGQRRGVDRVKRLRVGVLYGGRSGEHEVSLASAAAVFANLDRKRYEPIAIRIEKDGRWVLADRPPSAASAAEVIDQMRSDATRAARRPRSLPAAAARRRHARARRSPSGARRRGRGRRGRSPASALDVIFPVLHGPYGEDGTIQGLLELANVAYVGCGVLASAVGMDKAVMKVLFRARGLRVAGLGGRVPRATGARRRPRVGREHRKTRWRYPLFVKPANLGSSVGISKVHGPRRARRRRSSWPPTSIARSSSKPPCRTRARSKCARARQRRRPKRRCPARSCRRASSTTTKRSTSTPDRAPRFPRALDRRDGATRCGARRSPRSRRSTAPGFARVDFLLSRTTGELFVNEINTMPGFTTISMFSKMWEASGVDYPALVDRLIALALERHAEKQELEDERVLTRRARRGAREFLTHARTLCLTAVFCSSIIYILRENDSRLSPLVGYDPSTRDEYRRARPTGSAPFFRLTRQMSDARSRDRLPRSDGAARAGRACRKAATPRCS